jgi:hypothetical protein
VTAWIMTRPDRLDDADKAGLDAILAASPELAAVAVAVRAFAAIMNERRGRRLLEPWMTAALATGEPALKSFVTGLRADQDAVVNGLSLRWSSGSVEGRVHRIILWNQLVKWNYDPGCRYLSTCRAWAECSTWCRPSVPRVQMNARQRRVGSWLLHCRNSWTPTVSEARHLTVGPEASGMLVRPLIRWARA